MEIKIDSTVKGTRIVLGNAKRDLINHMISHCRSESFEEISIPILQFQETFSGKVGTENQHMMYTFKDRGDRNLCLAPEYTAIIMQLAETYFKYTKDLKVFYVSECFRGEKPQLGRYRQFTQFGVEIINPSMDYYEYLIELATKLISIDLSKLEINREAVRGLDYYTAGKSFEIKCESLGAQKQICGGGSYNGGIGFALGIDRILLAKA